MSQSIGIRTAIAPLNPSPEQPDKGSIAYILAPTITHPTSGNDHDAAASSLPHGKDMCYANVLKRPRDDAQPDAVQGVAKALLSLKGKRVCSAPDKKDRTTLPLNTVSMDRPVIARHVLYETFIGLIKQKTYGDGKCKIPPEYFTAAVKRRMIDRFLEINLLHGHAKTDESYRRRHEGAIKMLDAWEKCKTEEERAEFHKKLRNTDKDEARTGWFSFMHAFAKAGLREENVSVTLIYHSHFLSDNVWLHFEDLFAATNKEGWTADTRLPAEKPPLGERMRKRDWQHRPKDQAASCHQLPNEPGK